MTSIQQQRRELSVENGADVYEVYFTVRQFFSVYLEL